MVYPDNNDFTLASDSDSEDSPPHKPTKTNTDPILPTHHKGRFPIATPSLPIRQSTNHFPSTRLQQPSTSIELTYPSKFPQVPAATYATTYTNHEIPPRTNPFPTVGISRDDFKHTASHSSLRQGLELRKRGVRIQVRGGRGDDLAVPSRWGWRRWKVYYLVLAFAVLMMLLVGSIILGIFDSDRKAARRAGGINAVGGER